MEHTTNPADVLIVEDDTDIRDALCQILEEEGYRVLGLSHGRDALDYLRENPAPQLLLLDLMMPVMNGWEFREQQLQDPRLSSIPVVIISADGGARREAASFRAQGFLLKPVELDDLLATVARFCRPGEGLAPAALG